MTERSSACYRGRFAPSPTGPLHFGSLLAATGSYLQARARQGEWLLRIEDLDPPREPAGAATQILHTLEQFGFEWDGEVVWQSQRLAIYEEILADLLRQGLAYRCGCTRRQIAEQAERLGLAPGHYSGHCRSRAVAAQEHHAIRLLSEGPPIAFTDAIQGPQRQHVEQAVGDFVLRRADGYIAYQLAVVVDDALQGITEVVRGSDLLDSTPRQLFLQQRLGYPNPAYLHLPVAVNRDGQKLSKQTFAAPLDTQATLSTLWQALNFLGQTPPPELLEGELDTLWQWAIAHWQAATIPRKLSLIYPTPEPSDEH